MQFDGNASIFERLTSQLHRSAVIEMNEPYEKSHCQNFVKSIMLDFALHLF